MKKKERPGKIRRELVKTKDKRKKSNKTKGVESNGILHGGDDLYSIQHHALT